MNIFRWTNAGYVTFSVIWAAGPGSQEDWLLYLCARAVLAGQISGQPKGAKDQNDNGNAGNNNSGGLVSPISTWVDFPPTRSMAQPRGQADHCMKPWGKFGNIAAGYTINHKLPSVPVDVPHDSRLLDLCPSSGHWCSCDHAVSWDSVVPFATVPSKVGSDRLALPASPLPSL